MKPSIALTERTFKFPISSMEELRDEISALAEIHSGVGAAHFRGEVPDQVLVIFAGDREKYAMMSVAREVKCDVVMFQDSKSSWYQGSSILPGVLEIGDFLDSFLSGKNAILFGQSAGGYAALAASKNLKNAKVIAISPQTYSDGPDKGRGYFSKKLQINKSPDNLLDLRVHLQYADPSTRRAILVSSSEIGNPYEAFFWMDHLHAFRMFGLTTVEILMARMSKHALAHRRAVSFARFIAQSFEDPAWNGLRPFVEDLSEDEEV